MSVRAAARPKPSVLPVMKMRAMAVDLFDRFDRQTHVPERSNAFTWRGHLNCD